MSSQTDALKNMVELAGGKIVGKTRLQKAAYILELAGLGSGFNFTYHYYGPYSEDLTWTMKDAVVDGTVKEYEDHARWGGTYSVFTLPENIQHRKAEVADEASHAKSEILSYLIRSDAVVLELAATAAYLKTEGRSDYWEETRRRKSLKATPEALAQARELWERVRRVHTPRPLPALE